VKAKPPAKTYTRNTDPCQKRTETATSSDVVEMVEITVSTTTDDTLTMDNTINTTGMMDTDNALFDFTSPLNTATENEQIIVENVPILDTSLLINNQHSSGSSAHVVSANEKFEFFTDGIEAELMNVNFPDEGYSTSGSCSGKSSPTGSTGSEENYITLQPLDAGNTMTTLNLGDLNLDSMLDMDFTLLNGDQNVKHVQERDHVLEKEQDPHWNPSYIGTFDTVDDLVSSLGVGTSEEPKKATRNKKGPKQQPLETLPEKNHKNIQRCREYRKNKGIKQKMEESELEGLEQQNRDLQMTEKRMREQLSKMQGAYLKLITDGRIKFV